MASLIIRCKCKISTKNPCSSIMCTCRKNGLPCLSSCIGCRGEECSNCEVVIQTNEGTVIDHTNCDDTVYSERDNIFDLMNSELITD